MRNIVIVIAIFMLTKCCDIKNARTKSLSSKVLKKVEIYTQGKDKEFNYDSIGRKIREIDFDNGIAVEECYYTYNSKGLVNEQIKYFENDTFICKYIYDNKYKTEKYEYDNNGWLINYTKYNYYKNDTLKEVLRTDSATYKEFAEYDVKGNLKHIAFFIKENDEYKCDIEWSFATRYTADNCKEVIAVRSMGNGKNTFCDTTITLYKYSNGTIENRINIKKLDNDIPDEIKYIYKNNLLIKKTEMFDREENIEINYIYDSNGNITKELNSCKDILKKYKNVYW